MTPPVKTAGGPTVAENAGADAIDGLIGLMSGAAGRVADRVGDATRSAGETAAHNLAVLRDRYEFDRHASGPARDQALARAARLLPAALLAGVAGRGTVGLIRSGRTPLTRRPAKTRPTAVEFGVPDPAAKTAADAPPVRLEGKGEGPYDPARFLAGGMARSEGEVPWGAAAALAAIGTGAAAGWYGTDRLLKGREEALRKIKLERARREFQRALQESPLGPPPAKTAAAEDARGVLADAFRLLTEPAKTAADGPPPRVLGPNDLPPVPMDASGYLGGAANLYGAYALAAGAVPALIAYNRVRRRSLMDAMNKAVDVHRRNAGSPLPAYAEPVASRRVDPATGLEKEGSVADALARAAQDPTAQAALGGAAVGGLGGLLYRRRLSDAMLGAGLGAAGGAAAQRGLANPGIQRLFNPPDEKTRKDEDVKNPPMLDAPGMPAPVPAATSPEVAGEVADLQRKLDDVRPSWAGRVNRSVVDWAGRMLSPAKTEQAGPGAAPPDGPEADPVDPTAGLPWQLRYSRSAADAATEAKKMVSQGAGYTADNPGYAATGAILAARGLVGSPRARMERFSGNVDDLLARSGRTGRVPFLGSTGGGLSAAELAARERIRLVTTGLGRNAELARLKGMGLRMDGRIVPPSGRMGGRLGLLLNLATAAPAVGEFAYDMAKGTDAADRAAKAIQDQIGAVQAATVRPGGKPN